MSQTDDIKILNELMATIKQDDYLMLTDKSHKTALKTSKICFVTVRSQPNDDGCYKVEFALGGNGKTISYLHPDKFLEPVD